MIAHEEWNFILDQLDRTTHEWWIKAGIGALHHPQLEHNVGGQPSFAAHWRELDPPIGHCVSVSLGDDTVTFWAAAWSDDFDKNRRTLVSVETGAAEVGQAETAELFYNALWAAFKLNPATAATEDLQVVPLTRPVA